MRQHTRHHHPCAVCGTKTPCEGQIEENYDGFPAWICASYHRPDGTIAEFVCDGCEWQREDAALLAQTGEQA